MNLEITENAAQFCLKSPARFWLGQPASEVCFHATVSLISVRVNKASASYNLSRLTAVQVVAGLKPHLRAWLDGKEGRLFSFAEDTPLPDLYALERRLWDWLADHVAPRTPAAVPPGALDRDEEHVPIDDPTLAWLARYARTAAAQDSSGRLYLYPARVGGADLADDIRRVLGAPETESPWYPRWLAALTRQLIDSCQIDLVAAYQAAPPSLRGRIHRLVAPAES